MCKLITRNIPQESSKFLDMCVRKYYKCMSGPRSRYVARTRRARGEVSDDDEGDDDDDANRVGAGAAA